MISNHDQTKFDLELYALQFKIIKYSTIIMFCLPLYVLFSWMLNLLKTGRIRDLNETDLYATLDDQKSSTLGDQLEKYLFSTYLD